MNETQIKVFDFFSGCGGASAGFRQAGMDIILGIDNDKDAVKTFNKNFPKVSFLNRDIRNIRTNELIRYIDKLNPTDYVLFCGCAPCQSFSLQNKNRSYEDRRSSLLSEFYRFIKEYRPHFIFCENVPGIQKLDNRIGPFTIFVKNLDSIGYDSISYRIIDAKEYGVPQRRKRLVMLASRIGKVYFPEYTHGLDKKNPYSVVVDYIKDLPPIKAGESHSKVPNHRCAGLSELNLNRIKSIKEGRSRLDWSKKLQLKCHKKYNGHRDVYGRLAWNEPSVTLTTRCTSLSNGKFGHPEQDRALSIRESARLQTFPDNFIFYGSSLGSLGKQVGNAVPVLMAKKIGEAFFDCIEKRVIFE